MSTYSPDNGICYSREVLMVRTIAIYEYRASHQFPMGLFDAFAINRIGTRRFHKRSSAGYNHYKTATLIRDPLRSFESKSYGMWLP